MIPDKVVSKIPVRTVIETAKKVLYTGHIGDGKIFIYHVGNVVKIRTEEEGDDALQDVEYVLRILLTYLYFLITILKQQSLGGNFTKKDNLNLTLAFIGEVQANCIKEIERVMDSIDNNVFTMEMTGLDKFKSKGEALYYYGVKENLKLSSLQRTLISSLKQSGYFVDEKIFKPHITLARRCIMTDDFNEQDFKKKIPNISMPIHKISLMKSERKKGNLVYSEIYKVIIFEERETSHDSI